MDLGFEFWRMTAKELLERLRMLPPHIAKLLFEEMRKIRPRGNLIRAVVLQVDEMLIGRL